MLYRIEFYSEIANKWLGMFRDEYINPELVYKMDDSIAMADFNQNLPVIVSENYDKGIEDSCHCYFTSEGYKRFKDSIQEWLMMLSKEVKVKLIRVKESKYPKLYVDEYQAVLLDN